MGRGNGACSSGVDLVQQIKDERAKFKGVSFYCRCSLKIKKKKIKRTIIDC